MTSRSLIRTVALFVAFGVSAASGSVGDDGPARDREASTIAGLRDPEVEARRNAALAIRVASLDVQCAALPTLIDLVREEKDGQVRLAVLDILTAMGPDADSAVPALIHGLRNPYGGRRMEQLHQDYRVAMALAAIGEPAVEGLRDLLDEEKENIRAEAAMALGRIGPASEPAIPALINLLGEESDRIRQEAAIALGSIGPAAIAPLLDVTDHPNPVIRARAVEALGYVPEQRGEALDAVLNRVRDEAPEVQAAALVTLARWEPPEESLAAALEESLRHEVEAVRVSAVNLLSGRPQLLAGRIPVLDSLLTHEDEGVTRHAAFLLHLLGPDAAPILVDALRRDGSRIDQIAEALALIGRPVAGPIAEATEDPDPRVRRGAALALGQIRPPAPGTVPRLTAGLNDPDPDARSAFLSAIGALGPRASGALPIVRALLENESALVRYDAIATLHRIAPRDERLPGDLGSILDRDDDPSIQRLAIETLRAIGPSGRAALPSVISALQRDDPEVRLAAASLIAAHGPAAAEAVPALGAMLDDPDPELRAITARTLAGLGKASRPALDPLIVLLDDPIAEVRGAAALALGSLELDAGQLRPHLSRALRDDEADVRDAARRGIQRLGSEGVLFVPDLIATAAIESDHRSIERSLRRFERTGPDEQSIPELVDLLTLEDEPVLLLAIKFLELAGPSAENAIPALDRLQDHSSPEVRTQAKIAIDQIRADPR